MLCCALASLIAAQAVFLFERVRAWLGWTKRGTAPILSARSRAVRRGAIAAFVLVQLGMGGFLIYHRDHVGAELGELACSSGLLSGKGPCAAPPHEPGHRMPGQHDAQVGTTFRTLSN